MDMILNVRLWEKDVAAISWNVDREYATIEFFESFAGNGWNISPLVIPLHDLLRGDRVFSFPSHAPPASSLFGYGANVPADGFQCNCPKSG